MDFSTKAIHAGQDPAKWTHRAVIPPISMATTFQQFAPAQHAGYEYSRSGNPTRSCLEECLAALECAEYALCFASGLAATVSLTHLLKAGDHVVCFDDLYGGTNRYFRTLATKMGIEVSFIDMREIDNIRKAIQKNTKVRMMSTHINRDKAKKSLTLCAYAYTFTHLIPQDLYHKNMNKPINLHLKKLMVWIETPTNPMMKLVDIQATTDLLKNHPGIISVVDNTFMSSYFQKPLTLGADIVMHSLTKYMNGHSDVVMGCIATNNEELYQRMKYIQNSLGTVPSPFDSFLVNRGLKTLHVRMERHMENGLAVAKFLENHKAVEKVIYPGLQSHPQYELSQRQCTGSSGMVSFYIKGGLTEAQKFIKNLKVFTLAESLGSIESLVEIPSLMTHASVPEDQRNQLGISDTLIRLSVGIESIKDILQDLDQALQISQQK